MLLRDEKEHIGQSGMDEVRPMTGDTAQHVTRLLRRMDKGDPSAADELLPLIYEELRDKACRFMEGQPDGHTLQPTALVHEAYLRLVDAHGGEGVEVGEDLALPPFDLGGVG